MKDFVQAEKLYLLGFNSNYINEHTEVSTQSLLKTLLSDGIKYTKSDIISNQIDFIRSNYSIDAIKSGYSEMMYLFENPDVKRRGKHLCVLGCGFGDYPIVFSHLLGNDEYVKLRNKIWHDKMTNTIRSRYGVDNVFEKSTFDDFVSSKAIADGRVKRCQTMIDRYGVESPLQNKSLLNKAITSMKDTNQKRYGVDYAPQRPDVAEKILESRQSTMMLRYGVANSVEDETIRNKIFQSRRDNGTMNSSLPEAVMGNMLIEIFGKDNVVYNEIIDSRYPSHVDYYIKSRDLFIELNGDACHHTHWFNSESLSDCALLQLWQTKVEEFDTSTGKHSRYASYIKTWTKSDLEKRWVAKLNNLNYLVFWDGDTIIKDKMRYPVLSDFRLWLSEGTPNSKEWCSENTY